MSNETNPSLSLAESDSSAFHGWPGVVEKIGLVFVGIGLAVLVPAAFGAGEASPMLFWLLSFGSLALGGLVYAVARSLSRGAAAQNTGIMSGTATARGVVGWILGITLTSLYVLLYWYPSTLSGLIRLHDPLSQFLRDKPANEWFLYGTFYTGAVLVMGVKAILKYRHSRYHIVRTTVIMVVQLAFGFLIPQLLQLFNEPEFYFSYFWPLKPEYLFPDKLSSLTSHPGALGMFMAFWGGMMSFIAVPALTYFFGKRWYCSWVCGCGGLANTAGDSFRHLSSKTLTAWKIERWMIHSVLVFIVATTGLLWANSYMQGKLLGDVSFQFSRAYGFLIGSIFSGVIGVGFYPLMGTRVWCRFGCPQAAILGLLQKYFSRFRITVNGGQCISCGNCSTYCEMGIDVKYYAQRGQNIVRASCVGCGMCSTVCPRGVLNLENGPVKNRV